MAAIVVRRCHPLFSLALAADTSAQSLVRSKFSLAILGQLIFRCREGGVRITSASPEADLTPVGKRRPEESVFARHYDRLRDRIDRALSYRCEGCIEWTNSHSTRRHMRPRHREAHSNKLCVEVSVEVLEKHLDRLALAIDRAGKRGAMYLPIYERIEAELEELRVKEARMERARQRLK